MFVLWVHGIGHAFGRVFAYVLAPESHVFELESYVFALESHVFALESHVFARKFGLAYPLETRRKDTTPFALSEILLVMKNVFVEVIAWIVVSFCLCLKWLQFHARFFAFSARLLQSATRVVAFLNRLEEGRNARTCTPRWRNW